MYGQTFCGNHSCNRCRRDETAFGKGHPFNTLPIHERDELAVEIVMNLHEQGVARLPKEIDTNWSFGWTLSVLWGNRQHLIRNNFPVTRQNLLAMLRDEVDDRRLPLGTTLPAPTKTEPPKLDALQVFNFETKQVRVLKKNGQPWWVAKDVCDVLKIKNPSNALGALEGDEKGIEKIYTLGGKQSASIINESGLYALILRSNKPEAKRFRKWITSEVLPTIRQTGRYEITASKVFKESLQERKVAVREKYAEARHLEATARQIRELRALAKEHSASLPPGFIERISTIANESKV